jgi:hypothetical protein
MNARKQKRRNGFVTPFSGAEGLAQIDGRRLRSGETVTLSVD